MADYRYHFYDMPSRKLIDTLPVEGASFSTELRGVGAFSGTIPLFADDLDARRVLSATIPHRTKIYIERENALVWGGRIIPPRDYDSASGRLSIKAEETLGIFAYRFLPSLSFTGVEQLDIARSLLTTLQSGPGGDVGLGATGLVTGRKRDRNYLAADQTVGLDAITNLSEVIDGFDFATQVAWGPTGAPVETIVFGYPRLGRSGSASGLVLEYDRDSGGNVTDYSWSDGAGLYTRSWAITTTEEGVTLVASTTNTALIGQGYPMLEQRQQYDGIVYLSTLQAHADALAAYSAGHRATASLTVKAGPGIEIGDWSMGDEVLVRISDHRFPRDPLTGAPGLVAYMRIVGWETKPGPEGAEQYEFTLADFLEAL